MNTRSTTVLLWSSALVAVLGASCVEPEKREDPIVGGGPHDVTHLEFTASPTHVKVGEKVTFKVTAHWAIPSVEDATSRTIFWLSEREPADMKPGGIFIPTKPGTYTVTAEYEGVKKTVTLTVSE